MKIIPLLLLMLGLGSNLPAAEFQLPEFDLPAAKLPSSIKAEPDRLSLVADFEHKDKNGQIPVYLINNTAATVELEAQDGDVYLKLEAQNADGQWQRAQPHAYSWCGNSYIRKELRAGHFVKISGYQPKKGSKSKVRFSFYHQKIQLSSNAGDALVSKRDVDLASRDALRIRAGDFEFVSRVALGEVRLVNEMDHIRNLQEFAVAELGDARFEAVAAEAVLAKVVKKFPAQEKAVNYARKHIEARAAGETDKPED